jgi:hypothetical protein
MNIFLLMTYVGNLHANLGGYFEVSLIMTYVSNLDTNLEGYCELFFV